MKIPRRYTKLDTYYKHGKDICDEGYLNFDDNAKLQMFVWESLGKKKYQEMFGTDRIDQLNGYYHGKHWMDIIISMKAEDGYEDEEEPGVIGTGS
jgi:hypothetical protein